MPARLAGRWHWRFPPAAPIRQIVQRTVTPISGHDRRYKYHQTRDKKLPELHQAGVFILQASVKLSTSVIICSRVERSSGGTISV
jgi:hypothetical protein